MFYLGRRNLNRQMWGRETGSRKDGKLLRDDVFPHWPLLHDELRYMANFWQVIPATKHLLTSCLKNCAVEQSYREKTESMHFLNDPLLPSIRQIWSQRMQALLVSVHVISHARGCLGAQISGPVVWILSKPRNSRQGVTSLLEATVEQKKLFMGVEEMASRIWISV